MARISRRKCEDALIIAERRKLVASLYLRGELQSKIGEQLKVDQGTVSRDLAALREQWQAEAGAVIGEVKARELAKIDETERQAWEGWARSLQDAESIRTIVKPGKKPRAKKGQQAPRVTPHKETVRTVECQAGDPRFLQVVLDCVQKRCEIFGIKKSTGLSVVAAKVYIGWSPEAI